MSPVRIDRPTFLADTGLSVLLGAAGVLPIALVVTVAGPAEPALNRIGGRL